MGNSTVSKVLRSIFFSGKIPVVDILPEVPSQKLGVGKSEELYLKTLWSSRLMKSYSGR